MTALEMARVLVVDDNPAARLTLETLLKAGGYSVDSAASAAEAVEKLEEQEYELVLSDLRMESPDAGYRVLAHARTVGNRPAMALITTETSRGVLDQDRAYIQPQGVQELLTQVADLISERASRRMRRQVRMQMA